MALTVAHKNKIRAAKLGSHHSISTKQKISNTKQGTLETVSHKEKISVGLKKYYASLSSPKTISAAGKKNMRSSRIRFIENNPGAAKKFSSVLIERSIGAKNPHWLGGITPLHLQIRNSFAYRQWRSDVFTRDGYTCQVCNQYGGDLHAHHIKAFSLLLRNSGCSSLIQACKHSEFWDINNGTTLCIPCHKKAHKK